MHVSKPDPNNVLSAEGLMMLKEHCIGQYGVPTWVINVGIRGVQLALRQARISTTQFLDLNERTGGGRAGGE